MLLCAGLGLPQVLSAPDDLRRSLALRQDTISQATAGDPATGLVTMAPAETPVPVVIWDEIDSPTMTPIPMVPSPMPCSSEEWTSSVAGGTPPTPHPSDPPSVSMETPTSNRSASNAPGEVYSGKDFGLTSERTFGIDTIGNPGCQATWCDNKLCDDYVSLAQSSRKHACAFTCRGLHNPLSLRNATVVSFA